MKTALFISPHLDDAAFSCAGTLIKLSRSGWKTVLLTVFTRSVSCPTGFALACQIDKNLLPEIDYMKLRRQEDARFAQIAEVAEIVHLDFAEAPHRGYNSAPELFAGIKPGDSVWRDIAEKLNDYLPADLIFAPQGVGNHADHLQTIRALLDLKNKKPVFWYRDTPYAIRNPNAEPSDLLSADLSEIAVDISTTIEQKIIGCQAYKTQIDFQFGGEEKLATELHRFHRAEADRSSQKFDFAEVFLTAKIG